MKICAINSAEKPLISYVSDVIPMVGESIQIEKDNFIIHKVIHIIRSGGLERVELICECL